ncbi:MAG: thioredoxin family protein [Candidatus Hodarchaeota archaeon]
MTQISASLLEANSTDYESYLKTMTDSQKEMWKENYEKVSLNEEIKQVLRSPSRPINIVAFSGAWCGECAMTVPILAQMASMSKFLTLHIIDRDQSPELYEPFTPNGDKRVPVVIFTSEDYFVITQWVERCAIKFEMMWEVLQKRNEKEKEEIKEGLTKVFRENIELFRKETIKELSAELVRTVGTVNFSSRLKTTLAS